MYSLSSIVNAVRRTTGPRTPPVERAIGWVRKNHLPEGGIRVHHKSDSATQEVTGYLIPTLMNAGE